MSEYQRKAREYLSSAEADYTASNIEKQKMLIEKAKVSAILDLAEAIREAKKP